MEVADVSVLSSPLPLPRPHAPRKGACRLAVVASLTLTHVLGDKLTQERECASAIDCIALPPPLQGSICRGSSRSRHLSTVRPIPKSPRGPTSYILTPCALLPSSQSIKLVDARRRFVGKVRPRTLPLVPTTMMHPVPCVPVCAYAPLHPSAQPRALH